MSWRHCRDTGHAAPACLLSRPPCTHRVNASKRPSAENVVGAIFRSTTFSVTYQGFLLHVTCRKVRGCTGTVKARKAATIKVMKDYEDSGVVGKCGAGSGTKGWLLLLSNMRRKALDALTLHPHRETRETVERVTRPSPRSPARPTTTGGCSLYPTTGVKVRAGPQSTLLPATDWRPQTTHAAGIRQTPSRFFVPKIQSYQ